MFFQTVILNLLNPSNPNMDVRVPFVCTSLVRRRPALSMPSHGRILGDEVAIASSPPLKPYLRN
jgi:hypothetical protein